MKTTLNYKKFINYFVGIAITGLGLTLVYAADLGSSPMATLAQGVGRVIKILPGTANIYLNIIAFLIVLIINKKEIKIGTIMSTVAFGFFTNIWFKLLEVIFSVSDIKVRSLLFVIGIVIESYGLSYYMKADLGYGSMEIITSYIAERFNKSFAFAKQITDASLVISGVILGGKIGVGTILSVVFIGILMNLFLEKGKKDEII